MAETILVTGATGNVGSEVVKQLSRNRLDVNIVAAVHSVKNAKRVEADGIEVVSIDYNKPESLSAAFKDADKLFLLTQFQSGMVQHSSNLLTEVKNVGTIKHIVKLSVMGAEGEPGGRLHRQAEKMIENSGITYTFLRPNAFMQNFVNFYSHPIKEQGALYLPAGDGKVSFVDVRDIASVAVQALLNNNDGRHNGKTHDITGPEAISYDDATRILSEQVGKKISYVNVSEDDAHKATKEIGLDDWLVNTILEGYRYLRKGHFSPVTTVVEELTGKNLFLSNSSQRLMQKCLDRACCCNTNTIYIDLNKKLIPLALAAFQQDEKWTGIILKDLCSLRK
jgi:uncharacterized protein YbjT (DUF2867 family)